MRNHLLCIGAAAMLWPLGAGAQPASDASPPKANCQPLQLLNEVQLSPAVDGTVTVPVKVNGQDMEFVLDTAVSNTVLSAEMVVQNRFPTGLLDQQSQMVDATGHVSRMGARVGSFGFGRLKGGEAALLILPMREAGALGLDYLINYDLDLDFGAERLRLFSQDHCPGKVMYWQAAVLGRVPLEPSTNIPVNSNVNVRVELDGHPMLATINTAAAHSWIGIETAEKVFHLDAGAWSEGQDPPAHAFEKLAFGDVEVRNPHFELNPIRTRSHNGGFADLMIGMDIPRKLHVYFAFKEQTMYVSPASETFPAPPASASPAAPGPESITPQ